ncbi:hypothetical protein L1049_015144 [Liquidambar formosana]|uniref:Uncharacterized protein n=1 Tax=Liquidambar formosana TaxID=63359 RepID=A0AAP0RX31_LIQFO
MFRQSPSRNQRSKSFKVKHVLQVCMLLAVCFWLIYQVKHSHDKKKEFDENGSKISAKTQNGEEILRFGRKDLNPLVEEKATNNEKHEEEEVEEEEAGGGEEEENKHEEEEQEEEESKSEDREDEGRGGGDDEIDELDQEKTEGETDREEDFVDEDKEKEEEGDEKESEEKEGEEKEGQLENESSVEDQDHDGGGRNTHEAREEHYKGDDASSAVAHDTQTIGTENEKAILENSNENENMNIVGQENKSNDTDEINVDQKTASLNGGEGEMAEENGNEIISSKSEDSSLQNSRTTTESNDQPEANINSSEASTETPLATVQNGIETVLDSDQAKNATVEVPTTGEGSNLQTTVLEQSSNI